MRCTVRHFLSELQVVIFVSKPKNRMADKGNDSGEEEEATIAEDVVVTKYKMAGDMANRK